MRTPLPFPVRAPAIASGLALFLVLLLATGCSGGYLITIDPPPEQRHYPTARVRAAPALGGTYELRRLIEQSIQAKLSEAGMRPGDDLTIEYRVLFDDTGSRLHRFFWLGLVGEGKVEVEVVYKDAAGEPQARIQAEGTIQGGLLGGAFSRAIDEAASRVASYTLLWFWKGPSEAPLPRRLPGE